MRRNNGSSLYNSRRNAEGSEEFSPSRFQLISRRTPSAKHAKHAEPLDRGVLFVTLSRDRWVLTASCRAINNSGIDSNSLIVCLAGEIIRQLNMLFLYISAGAFFWLGSLSGISCFASYCFISFDTYLSDLSLFITRESLSTDFLFPNEV